MLLVTNMYFKHSFLITTALITCFVLVCNARSQEAHETEAPETQAAKTDGPADPRRLQSDEFLVETAYLEDEAELQHKFTFSRSSDRTWATDFTEEMTLGSEKHQFVFTVPMGLNVHEGRLTRGFGDAEIAYSYGLYGNSASRITISPGVVLHVPVGDVRKDMGRGGAGASVKLPVSVVITKRFASNSIFEIGYTPRARNSNGDRSTAIDYNVGQSFVWFAKPRVNLFVEAVWERSQQVTGPGMTRNEYSLLVSPAVRWTYEFSSGLTVTPGIAVPTGMGPSRGEQNIFFYIAFGHPIRHRSRSYEDQP